jgi:hypothetical protein
MLYRETQASLVANNEVGLEQIAEKTKYMSMSCHQSVWQGAM